VLEETTLDAHDVSDHSLQPDALLLGVDDEELAHVAAGEAPHDRAVEIALLETDPQIAGLRHLDARLDDVRRLASSAEGHPDGLDLARDDDVGFDAEVVGS